MGEVEVALEGLVLLTMGPSGEDEDHPTKDEDK